MNLNNITEWFLGGRQLVTFLVLILISLVVGFLLSSIPVPKLLLIKIILVVNILLALAILLSFGNSMLMDPGANMTAVLYALIAGAMSIYGLIKWNSFSLFSSMAFFVINIFIIFIILKILMAISNSSGGFI